MKSLFLILCSTLVMVCCYAQRIASDKTDDFSNTRTITTSRLTLETAGLSTLVRAYACARIFNGSTTYILTFITPDNSPAIHTSTDGTKVCTLKLDNGETVTGELDNSAATAILDQSNWTFTYNFNKEAFQKLSHQIVSNLKFIGDHGQEGVYDLDRKGAERLRQLVILVAGY